MTPTVRLGRFLAFQRYVLPTLALVGLFMPLWASGYILRVSSVFYIHLLLAVGLSIIVTYAGLLNMGYAAFFAIGAYSYALLNTSMGLSFWAVIPIGIIASALFAFLLGFPTLRVRGDYLALVTLAFGEITRILLLNIWGPHGISRIAPPLSAQSVGGFENLYLVFYYVTFVPIFFAIWLLGRLQMSKTAHTWAAIRDNELAAQFSGIFSMKWLMLALVLGGVVAGLAGVIFAGIQRFVSPVSFALEESIFLLSIVVLAGGNSRIRLVLAAAVLSLLPEILRDLADYRLLIYGGLLAGVVIVEEQLTLRRRRGTGNRGPQTKLQEYQRQAVEVPECLMRDCATKELTLAADKVTMRFGGLTAVDHVSFNVALASRCVGLIGPNGAGKTTLFNCISGHYQPTEGVVTFDGSVRKPSPSHAARLGIGRTFQTPQLFHTMTVRENIMTAAMHRDHERNADAMVSEIMKYLGIDFMADMYPSSLPLGFQRLTELGRALALRPKIVLIDEIASGLNSREKEYMSSLIRDLSTKAGIGFVVVEHDMDFVLPLAAEILVLESGKLIAQGTPDVITKDPLVIDAYLGRSYGHA